MAKEEAPPFGAYTLSPWRGLLRRLSMKLPSTGPGKWAESVTRRLMMLRARGPIDVEVFPRIFARLHPRDNLCEKRVLSGPQFWDRQERRLLSQRLRSHVGPVFSFVDAGANVGFYSLFVFAEAATRGIKSRILAIEPDPVNRSRMAFNMNASKASDIVVSPVALGAKRGHGFLVPPSRNRGEVRIALVDGGGNGRTKIEICPLAEVLAAHDFDRVDFLKVDVEGAEEEVLSSFFDQAARSLWPKGIILEDSDERGNRALRSCLESGYEITGRTRLNYILERVTDTHGAGRAD